MSRSRGELFLSTDEGQKRVFAYLNTLRLESFFRSLAEVIVYDEFPDWRIALDWFCLWWGDTIEIESLLGLYWTGECFVADRKIKRGHTRSQLYVGRCHF